MQTTLTYQDVQDAYYARRTADLARTEETTPADIIAEFADTPAEIDSDTVRFARGTALLKDYALIQSDRSVAGGRFDAATHARIVSPIISVTAGYVGTAEAYRAVGLAQR